MLGFPHLPSSIDANIESIARECHKAVKAAGTSYDEKADADAYDMACFNIARFVSPTASPADSLPVGSPCGDKHGGEDPDDMDSLHAALSLRYYWAGKLHEMNKRFSPIYDYEDSKYEARNIAIEGDGYIERVIDFLPVP